MNTRERLEQLLDYVTEIASGNADVIPQQSNDEQLINFIRSHIDSTPLSKFTKGLCGALNALIKEEQLQEAFVAENKTLFVDIDPSISQNQRNNLTRFALQTISDVVSDQVDRTVQSQISSASNYSF